MDRSLRWWALAAVVAVVAVGVPVSLYARRDRRPVPAEPVTPEPLLEPVGCLLYAETWKTATTGRTGVSSRWPP